MKTTERSMFKDQVVLALLPMFVQMMAKVNKKSPLLTGQPEDGMAIVSAPDPMEVGAVVFNYAEGIARIRELHTELSEDERKNFNKQKASILAQQRRVMEQKQAMENAAPAPKMEVNRTPASNNGGGDDNDGERT